MSKICYVVTMESTIKAFFLPQLKCLSENGFEVTVICSGADRLQDELTLDINCIKLDMPRGISVKKSFFAIWQLIKNMKKEQYDIVQYSTPNAGFYAAIASRMAKIKVRNYHLMGFRYQGAKGVLKLFLKYIEKITCKLSTHIECVSKTNMEFGISERIFNCKKACVIGNGSTGGVDLSRFDIRKREYWRKQVRNELGYMDTDFVYGYVGRINKDKGILELLEAYKMLDDDSKLLLIGDIEDYELKEKIQTIRSTEIAVHRSVKNIECYYAAIDVLVLPSYREGFGNVVIESEAMGTPVIVSNIPGPIDAIEMGKTGLISNVGDVKSLKNTMKQMKDTYESFSAYTCFEFVRKNFDSEILNELILNRKKDLLESILK